MSSKSKSFEEISTLLKLVLLSMARSSLDKGMSKLMVLACGTTCTFGERLGEFLEDADEDVLLAAGAWPCTDTVLLVDNRLRDILVSLEADMVLDVISKARDRLRASASSPEMTRNVVDKGRRRERVGDEKRRSCKLNELLQGHREFLQRSRMIYRVQVGWAWMSQYPMEIASEDQGPHLHELQRTLRVRD